jgi:Vacuolar membrane-associated protein Iml1
MSMLMLITLVNTAGITKQRMMDNGIGMDMVSLSQPPLHTAPLFIHKSTDSVFTNRDTHQHQGDTPLEDPRYEVPHWMNLSFATSPDKTKDAAAAALDTLLLPDSTTTPITSSTRDDVSDVPLAVTKVAVTAAEKLDRKRERKQREEVRLPIPKLVNAPLFRPNDRGDIDVFSYLPTALAVLLNVNSGSNSSSSSSSSCRVIGVEEVLQCTSSSTSRRNSGAAIVVPHAVTALGNSSSSNSYSSSTLTQHNAAQLLQELAEEESDGASPVATAAAALTCLLQQQQDDSSRSSLSAATTKLTGIGSSSSSSSSSGVLHMWGAAHQSPAGKLKIPILSSYICTTSF